MKIAVLSDLHVDRSTEPSSWELAKAAFRAASRADHVIIAGDLFDSSGAMERDADTVRRFLSKLGLWHADRLTLIVGNHDIFTVGHRGPVAHRARGLVTSLAGRAQHAYNVYCEIAGELVPDDGRHSADDLFPFRKDLDGVTLVAVDTTCAVTLDSAEGRWSRDDDLAARALVRGAHGLRLLAIHHPPEQSEATGILERLAGYGAGFPRRDLQRLTRFADDLRLDAIVCGHIHDNEGAPWTWRLGYGTRVFMMGRTGGLHGATPCFDVLDVPRRGPLRRRTVRL